MSSYARDPIGETSACVVLCVAQSGVEWEPCGRREVFPLGGTAWEDDKNLPHKFEFKTIKWEKLATSDTT